MRPHLSPHLNEDELIDALYGLREATDHVAACPECLARWERAQARRRESGRTAPVSSEFLAAQRRAIYARLGERPGWRMRLVPVLAAAGALAIALVVYRPAARVPHSDPGDAQLFVEVYSMEQSSEASSAVPIHGLFEDNQ